MEELLRLLTVNIQELNQLSVAAFPKFRENYQNARLYFEEHVDDCSLDVMVQRIKKVQKLQNSNIKYAENIAQRLVDIPDLMQNLQNGEEQVLNQVINAFHITSNGVTECQIRNAVTFCALVSPEHFIAISKETWNLLKPYLEHAIDAVTDGLAIYHLITNVFNTIKDNHDDLSFADINATLRSIWIILTDPRVIDAGIDVAIHVGARVLGIPAPMGTLLARLLAIGIVDVLRPNLNRYHQRIINQKRNINRI